MTTMTTERKNTAGELLRQGRLRQRLSIAECSKRTHIAQRFIEALEDEKWGELPSESHRVGFLRLYSRFLGVPVEDILMLYRQRTLVPTDPSVSHGAPARNDPPMPEFHPVRDWSPSSMAQVIGLAILILLLAWVIYHVVSPRLAEQNPMPWGRRRTPTQARLVVPKSSIVAQKVRLQAQSDSWLRVVSRNQLLFEGILPAGASKEWSGTGPFQLKIGNVRALSLFWNDQPVDILAGAHGMINEIRIPPQ